MAFSWRLTCTFIAVLCTVSLGFQYSSAQNAQGVSQADTPAGLWQSAAPMNERREYAGGVLLQNGSVLAVSGHPLEGKSIASAELYDPQTGEWSNTGSLREPRNGGNSATLLLDGRVLLAGGHNNVRVISGAELFDPTTGKWSDTGSLSVGRDPVATLLADGRVLAAGGIDWFTDSGKAHSEAELYDPNTGEWTPTGSMTTARYAHKATLLNDGRVLHVGGYQEGDVLLASAELYDPKTGLWKTTGDLPSSRVAFSLVKLHDGRVLIVGGFTGLSSKTRTYVASAALYDPKTGYWSETKPMNARRAGFSTTLLPNGKVLVAGGWAESQRELKEAELFDPATQTWHFVASMNVARRNHRATLLSDGRVLVIGGSYLFGDRYLASCEIFRIEIY